MQQQRFDIIIIGGGASGLSLALQLSTTFSIAILTKAPVAEGSTRYAQGGISAVLDPSDSIELHVKDTINAGGGLCHSDVVRQVARGAPQQIQWLIDLGVPFTTDASMASGYHLTREGGHSQRRVIHVDDTTGRSLSDTLIKKVRERPNIQILEHYIALDIIKSKVTGRSPSQTNGLYVYNQKSLRVEVFASNTVVLATGGASKVYLYTSNPDVSTGDGIAMAWRAGCRVANMEFIQFHPTCLYHPHAKSFLISEAIRGEGAKLILPDGTRFMEKVHAQAELAPRDVVARTIDHEMKRLGLDCVYLDISFKSQKFIQQHFPNIYERCLQFGLDMSREPIPIVPAAHYTCGGVIANLAGETDIEGLYAIGETAHTGLHGANRMASNSLLECLVVAAKTAQAINKKPNRVRNTASTLTAWDESQVTTSKEEIVVAHNWDELRRFMWDYVGIVRTDQRLTRALRRIHVLTREIDEYYSHFQVNNDLIELRNLAQVAELIIRSAICRKESRGLHYTLDYPEKLAVAQDTILTPPNHPSLDPLPRRDAPVTA